ncbi:MAG: DUF2156 domain-containing protein [Nakamurella sp.]
MTIRPNREHAGGTAVALPRLSDVTTPVSRVRALTRRVPTLVRSAPATSVLCAVMIVAAVLTALAGTTPDALQTQLGYGLPAWQRGDLLHYFTGALVLPTPELYVVMGPLIVLAVGYYERRAGSLRAISVLLLTHLIGALGITALLALADADWQWAALLARQTDLGISAGTIGVLAAATWVMPGALGRRIRWIGSTYIVVMVLRSGLLWDAEHLFGWTAGLVIGPRLARRVNRTAHGDPQAITGRAPRIKRVRAALACTLVVLAVSKLVTTLYPGNGGIFGPGLPPSPPMPGRVIGAAVLLVLALLVGNALRRGLPLAWWAAVGLAVVGLTSAGLMHGTRYTADLLLWGLLLAGLVAGRGYWPWRLPAGALARALPRMLVAVGGFLALSVLTWWLLRSQLDGGIHPHQIVNRALFEEHAILARTRTADALLTATSVIWAIALLAVALPLLYSAQAACRTPRRRRSSGRTDEQVLTDLVVRHGGGTLGWQRTWPGFTAWISTTGDVGVGYKVVSGVAIAIGDPVGPLLRWRAGVAEFQKFCLRNGWTPAWYTVSDRFLEVMGDEWRHTVLGEDAVIDLSALAFTGKSWQDVRTARNRAERDGIRCERIDLRTCDPLLRSGIDEVSSGWVNGKPLPEMGFTLGTVAIADDDMMRTYVALDAAGTVHGVTTWMPVHRGGKIVGWTLDVMRRHCDGFRPVMEFLIAECVLQFQAEGYDIASLSVAPLARPAGVATADPDLLSKALDRIGEMLEPAYGFRSLLQYKTKFHPRFETVHLAYFSQMDLAEIAVAIGRAYLPELSAGQALSIARALRPRREGGDSAGRPVPAERQPVG